MSSPSSRSAPSPSSREVHCGHGASEHHQHAHGSGCDSRLHTPGQCHGFETVQAAGPGVWTEAGHDFDLNRLLNPEETRKKESRRAVITLGICAGTSCVVMVAELVVGYLEGSLVLISDGAHQLSDVIMYLALMASVVLSQRQGSLQSYSFGYHRAQVLGSLFALLLQYFLTGLVVEAAVGRLLQKQLYAVNGDIICMIASGSFAANIFLRILTSKMMPASIGHGHSHGGGGGSDDSAAGVARLHIVADLLQSIVCISIGATIWLRPELAWLDSLSGLFYGVLVLCTTARKDCNVSALAY